jgi:hypothetical protein
VVALPRERLVGVDPRRTTSTAVAPIGTSLVFDTAGRAHIAWGGGSGSNRTLLHHVVDGGIVTRETAERVIGSVNGRYPSIAVGPDSTVRITAWDGRTESGSAAAAGVHFVRLAWGDEGRVTQRVTIVR